MVVMEETRLRPNIWLLTGTAETVQGGSEDSLAEQGFRSYCYTTPLWTMEELRP